MHVKKTQFTLAELAAILGAELRGDPTCNITGIASLHNVKAGQIAFLDNIRYRKYLANTQASAVILSSANLVECHTNALILDNPYLGYAKVATLFDQAPVSKPGIHPTAVIGENCEIHPSVCIGPLCVIGANVKIGENVVISPGCIISDQCSIGADSRLWSRVTVYHNVQIGQRVIIHSGVVIGSDGFGFAQDKGIWNKVPQLGTVIIGNDVEIGANTTIDRGALDNTVLHDGVKIDNLVQIGHNVSIGAHTAIAGCTGIAGSTTIGKHCAIGGATSLGGHISIADQVIITGASAVSNSITEPGMYSSGIVQVQPALTWKKTLIRLNQLDEMAHRLRELEKICTNLITEKT